MRKILKISACILLVFLVIVSLRFSAHTQSSWWQEYVAMRDGVGLNTKVFLPDSNIWGNGPYPVLLERTPYGVGEPDRFGDKDGNLPAPVDNGYACVIQDIRGRWYSEGIDQLFYGEAKDGYDTVEWIAEQSWCNGKVGQYGGSATGITTYLTASENPPHLVACYASIASANLYNDVVYEGGAFRFADAFAWTLGRIEGLSEDHLAKVVPSDQQNNIPSFKQDCSAIQSDMYNHMSTTYPNRPVDSASYMHLPLNGFHSSFSVLQPWIDEVLSHPSEDEFRDYMTTIDKIEVPILHVGGWYDFFGRSNIEAFFRLQHKGNQKLIMAPGTHENLGLPSNHLYEWFDYWLKGEDTEIMNRPSVAYYCLGANEWRYADYWPPNGVEPITYYFHGNGEIDIQPCAIGETPESYIYDPRNPVLTHGGRNLVLPAGAFDQREIKLGRNDILTYTSKTLTSRIEVKGRVEVVLSGFSNCTDTDFTAKLIDVYPDGTEMLVLDGIIRARYRQSMETPTLMTPNNIYQFKIDLGDISYIFKSGHRLQVDISSSNFPKYDRNLNTGGTLYTETEFNVAENTIYHDNIHPSYITLNSPAPAITKVFTVYVDTQAYQVKTFSNSSISGFNFSLSQKQISFNVTGPTGTTGFCDVTIPDDLLWGEFSLFMNGALLVEHVDYTQTHNGTHYIFYVTYVHSTHTIEIRGTEVTPEFPTWISMLILLIVLTVAVAIYKRRLRPRGKPYS